MGRAETSDWVSVSVLLLPSGEGDRIQRLAQSPSEINKETKMRSLLTTQNQNCYREMIKKEAYTRLTWKMKYSEDYPTCFASRRPKDVGLPKLPGTKPLLPPVPKLREKKREPPAPTQTSLSEAPLMRPVSPQTRDMLYQGLSKEGNGRSFYLHQRVQKGPEERFHHPMLSSWDYGWRLGDYGNEYRSPAHGRSGVVRSTFYARNGIFNIPSPTDQLG
ncbi:protein ATP6V1FNB [Denticeps clupeoides]|uniref:protein ATP6V1FNB n=1 Tax=Denticeps clupeoides TaxID=299321 RepID=UPI0010A3BAA0|nr:protein ATP6V1FNB [Denticeps clupeoides]